MYDKTGLHLECLDALHLGLATIVEDGEEEPKIEFANRSWRSVFGQSSNSVADILRVFPQAAPVFNGELRNSWVEIQGAQILMCSVQKSNCRHLVLFPSQLVKFSDGSVETLVEQYDDLMEVFNNCFDGIYVSDGDGKTLWMNPGFERVYGLSAEDFLGKSVRELESQGFVDPLITWKVITNKKRVTAVQKTRSGKTVLATGIPLLNEMGEVRKVIINSRDTTEQSELKNRLNHAEKQIEFFETEVEELRSKTSQVEGMIWSSTDSERLVELASRLARVDTSLLISGEPGVGKETIARLVHSKSWRSPRNFVKVTCGGLPDEVLEAELFGNSAAGERTKKGPRGLLERAHNGTLFLDDVGEMSLNMQSKFVRVLQDGYFTSPDRAKPVKLDFRIIASTAEDLEQLVRSKQFREDLYYRLNVVPVEVSPIRKRKEDIISLSHEFLKRVNKNYMLSKRLDPSAISRLINYHWPGNTRELRSVIERAAVTSRDNTIRGEDIMVEFSASQEIEVNNAATQQPNTHMLLTDIKSEVARYEAQLLQAAIEKSGSIRAAADATGYSVSTIKRKAKRKA